MKKTIVERKRPEDIPVLSDHPVLDRIYATRGIRTINELEHDLNALLPYTLLKSIDVAINRLSQALMQQERILIVGDYDTDGATSTAVVIRALKAFGAQHVDYLVPNRFEYGYGLSAKIVELAIPMKPNLIITVDNGIVSFEGVDRANEAGIDVVITDHHLAEETLPNAVGVINPNQLGDEFPSKNLAGCGVAFYLMLALRGALRDLTWFQSQAIPEPNMAQFLDLVALGTVADVVPLDKNNRILVQQGIKRMRAGKVIPGIAALLKIGKRNVRDLVSSDLGFVVAPRLNAAGRLDDMSMGIECLLADDPQVAQQLAQRLDTLNIERRQIENEMKSQAFAILEKLQLNTKPLPLGLCLYQHDWHQGVTGIVASRVKDKWQRPVVVFAKDDQGQLKGSARSIPGFHIRDAFEAIAKKYPGLILKYGGHAMAAGLTLKPEGFAEFEKAFAAYICSQLTEDDLADKYYTDGQLDIEHMNMKLAQLIRESGPWGQHFPEPLFHGEFDLLEQRIVGDNHLKLTLSQSNKPVDAIAFNIDTNAWPNHRCRKVKVVYRLDVNKFRMQHNLQLLIEYIEAV